MNEQQYRAEIDAMADRLGHVVSGESVGVIVPALMEILLSIMISMENKQEALASMPTLHNMMDYIESQLQAVH